MPTCHDCAKDYCAFYKSATPYEANNRCFVDKNKLPNQRETHLDEYFKTLGEDEVNGIAEEIKRLSHVLHQYALYLREKNRLVAGSVNRNPEEI